MVIMSLRLWTPSAWIRSMCNIRWLASSQTNIATSRQLSTHAASSVLNYLPSGFQGFLFNTAVQWDNLNLVTLKLVLLFFPVLTKNMFQFFAVVITVLIIICKRNKNWNRNYFQEENITVIHQSRECKMHKSQSFWTLMTLLMRSWNISVADVLWSYSSTETNK